jgi:hypothetical protein
VATVQDTPSIECEACGRQFRWKPEIAGRSVRCLCGTRIKAPQTPPVPAGVGGRSGVAVSPPPDEAGSSRSGPLGSLLETLDRPVEVPAPTQASPASGFDSSIWPKALPPRKRQPSVALRLVGAGALVHAVGFCGFALAVAGQALVLAGVQGARPAAVAAVLLVASLVVLAIGPGLTAAAAWTPGRTLSAAALGVFITSGIAMAQVPILEQPLNVVAGLAAALLVMMGGTCWSLLMRRLAVETNAPTWWTAQLVRAMKVALLVHAGVAPLILLLPSTPAAVLGMLVLLADGFLLTLYLYVTTTLGWQCLRR